MRSDDLALLTTEQMLEELARRHRTVIIGIAGVGRRNDGRSMYKVRWAGLGCEAIGLLSICSDQIAADMADEIEEAPPADGAPTEN